MRKIALISEYASPLALTGRVDSSGQNGYGARLTRQLSHPGFHIDIFTRRDAGSQETVAHREPGVRFIDVPAGPAQCIPQKAMLPYMKEFTPETHEALSS